MDGQTDGVKTKVHFIFFACGHFFVNSCSFYALIFVLLPLTSRNRGIHSSGFYLSKF